MEGTPLDDATSSELIWNSLLIMTSARSRPLVAESKQGIILSVLSNILDIAVQTKDKQRRRKYIGRIMTLKKSSQKTIMEMIESRNKTSKKSPPRSSRKTPPRHKLSIDESSTATPPNPVISPLFCGGDDSADFMPCSGSRGVKDSSPTRRVSSFRSPDSNVKSVPTTSLTPGTLDSPNKLQQIVGRLQQKTDMMEKEMREQLQTEEELKQQIDKIQNDHRQSLLKAEAQALDRIQEIQHHSEETVRELQNELQVAKQNAQVGEQAMRELKAAREELEVLSGSKNVLTETTEKLRVYKEKIAELQDVKEALKREQDTHGRAVDEIVRLESIVQELNPVKRQLEDYKIRAIEAEVKLVETQDYLKRIETHAKSQNEHLYQSMMLQKEQMEEMRSRIVRDTTQSQDGVTSGVGDGISELNPELKEELTRLRNENLRLRAFQAKRTEDAVQHLEESLDDSKRLADRFKNEFLETKDRLGDTQEKLDECTRDNQNLVVQVQQWQANSNELENQCRSLQDQVALVSNQLDQTKQSLRNCESQNAQLRENVRGWMHKTQQADDIAADRLVNQQKTQEQLEATKAALRESNVANEELRDDITQLQSTLEEKTNELDHLDNEFQKTSNEYADLSNRLVEQEAEASNMANYIDRLKQDVSTLEETLQRVHSQHEEEMEDSKRRFDDMQESLKIKHNKDLKEIQSNMNKLLNDERRAYKAKDEESRHIIKEAETDFNFKYQELSERSSLALKHSREEAQERLDLVKKEYEEQIAKLSKEHKQSKDQLVRKGKQYMEEAKTKATEELQRIDDECTELEKENARLSQEKRDVEHMLRGEIASMRSQLSFANSKADDLSQESEEYQDRVKDLEREKYKLSEENDRYRRQLGGRYGAEGQVHSQLEKLQKEYAVVVEENRSLRKQIRDSGDLLQSNLDSIAEGEEQDGRPYRRAGMDRNTLTQLRKEYEERIAELNDEKRDLVMKMSSQATDVNKAEKRVWDRDQELTKLKAENTSLQLSLQRLEMALDDMKEGKMIESSSPAHPPSSSPGQLLSFSPPRATKASPGSLVRHSSPGIDRAKRQKAAQENLLRSRFHNITGLNTTPPRMPQGATVLSDSKKQPTASQSGSKSAGGRTSSSKKVQNESSSSSSLDKSSLSIRSTSPIRNPPPSSTLPSTAGSLTKQRNPPPSRVLVDSSQQNSPSKMASDVFRFERKSIVDATQMKDRPGDQEPECKQS